MTAEPIRELSRVEFAQQVRDGIEAFDNSGGPYLESVHCHLARKLGYSELEIEEGVRQPWIDAAERVRKARAKQVEPVEAKIGEVEPAKVEAKPARTFRRVTGSNLRIVSNNAAKAVVAKFIRDNNLAAAEARKPEEEPSEEPDADEASDATPTSLSDLILPGVAGEVQDYFLRTAMQPSRIMSLAVGLMVPTTLVSGFVIGPSGPKGCALHQSLVVVAPTASGKQWAIDCAKECICEAGEGAQFLLGPNRFKSGTAVVRWVSDHRVSLCIQDEFGRLLAKFSDPKSNPCEVDINDRMREFWAIGPGGIYNSPHGASKLDDSVAIVDPRLNILGFGVHQEFYDACQVEDITNGFLNRLAVLDERNTLYPNTDLQPIKIPYSLKLNLEKLYGIKTPKKLDWTSAAKEIYDAEVKRVHTDPDERKRKLWGRTPERIVRAASTLAASRFATKVERKDMEIAQAIMRQSDATFTFGIDEAQKKRTFDHAGLKHEIIRRLKADFRNEASIFEVKRSFRHNSKHKKAVPDAIQDLIDSGTLTEAYIKTGGKPKVVYRLVEE